VAIPQKPAISRPFCDYQRHLAQPPHCLAEAGGFEARYGELESDGALSPVREKPQNLFPLRLISNSKRLNFENRTEWVESRASERNGPFGEQ
jgi:hypothetical protein